MGGERKRGVAWGLVRRERAKTQWDAERPQGAWRYLRGEEGVREHERREVCLAPSNSKINLLSFTGSSILDTFQ